MVRECEGNIGLIFIYFRLQTGCLTCMEMIWWHSGNMWRSISREACRYPKKRKKEWRGLFARMIYLRYIFLFVQVEYKEWWWDGEKLVRFKTHCLWNAAKTWIENLHQKVVFILTATGSVGWFTYVARSAVIQTAQCVANPNLMGWNVIWRHLISWNQKVHCV